MTLRAPLVFLALLVSTAASSIAFGHAHLLDPAPRTPINNGGLKTAPCGNIAAQGNFTEMLVGTSYTITWRETIDHPGSYRIALSTNGEAAFDTYIVVASGMDIQGGTLPRDYSAAITIPDTANCNPCVLQLRQFMQAADPYYYSCADVKFVTVLTPPTPTPTPTATPTPTPGGNGNDSVSGTALCSVTATGAIRLGGAAAALVTLGLAALLARRRFHL